MPKISIIIASDKLDKLFPAATLATTATVMGWDAELFFTFWALLALKKDYEPKEVSTDYKIYEDELKKAMSSGSIPKWRDILEQGKKTGRLKVYACSTTMDLFKLKANDLSEYVDGIVSAAYFLNSAKDSNITLFI